MDLLISVLALSYLSSFVSPDAQGDALYALRKSLNASDNQLADWNPDQVNPCTWSKITCNSNNDVISVKLPGNGISVEIPEEFGNLTSLTMLDLENNHLTREIPSLLGNIKGLKFLILGDNNLSGSIPKSLSSLSNLTDLQLSSNRLSGKIPKQLFQISKHNFTGNRLDCGIISSLPCASENAGRSRKSRTGMIVGIVVPLFAVLLLGCFLLLFMRKGGIIGYRREVFVDVAGDVDQRIEFGQLKRLSWRELQLATDAFSEKNVLGQGGFGKVYKGILGDNTKVAVKRLMDFESPGGDTAFQREIEMISVAVHRNLLRLIGFCTTPTERLLVTLSCKT